MKFGEEWKVGPHNTVPSRSAAPEESAAVGQEIKRKNEDDGVAGLIAHDNDSDSIVSDVSVTSSEQRAKVEQFCTYFVPGFSIALAIAFVLLVPLTAGGAPGAGNPKVVLFVVEGMKGTVFENLLNEMSLLPNIRSLIFASGSSGRYARCLSLQDSGCALSQSGPQLGQPFSFQSGPGLASILSGVDATKHKVFNDSYAAYQQYFATSKLYPSFLSLAMNAGFQTAVIGSSHLLTSISFGGTCSDYGILDFECSPMTAGMCLSTSTCNINKRSIVIPSNGFSGTEESSISDTLVPLLNDVGADVVVMHLGKLARMAADPAYPDWSFSESSLPFAAEAYLFDSIVGQVSAIAQSRAASFKENWLLLGVSDHGGLGKSFGSNTPDDQLITLFSSVITGSSVPITQQPFTTPTTQFDVAPTILTWLGVPFANNSFDGVVQGICSDGKYPKSCNLV
jgi:hypothetical protein